jgi:hypothetical protein
MNGSITRDCYFSETHSRLPSNSKMPYTTSPAFIIHLCYGDEENSTNDDVIHITPVNPTDMSSTKFNVIYKIAHGGHHRWVCNREAIMAYLTTVIRSVAADASVDRFTNIQISSPTFPCFMKLIPMPCEIEKTNKIIQLTHDQLNVLVSSGIWPSN